MILTRRRTFAVIAASFFLAYALTIVPLPMVLDSYRPDFVALTIFFWLVSVPNWIGVGIAWFCGLLLDTLHGSFLGQHALALTVLAYITLKFHRRIRVFTIWQELIALLFLIFIYHFLLFWSDGVSTRTASHGWSHMAQWFATVAIWPAWVLLLNTIARHSR